MCKCRYSSIYKHAQHQRSYLGYYISGYTFCSIITYSGYTFCSIITYEQQQVNTDTNIVVFLEGIKNQSNYCFKIHSAASSNNIIQSELFCLKILFILKTKHTFLITSSIINFVDNSPQIPQSQPFLITFLQKYKMTKETAFSLSDTFMYHTKTKRKVGHQSGSIKFRRK